jgi:hypothetical protein
MRYALAFTFGIVHALAAAAAFGADATGSLWVARVFAYDLGVEVAQWPVLAAVVAISTAIASRGARPRALWIRGASAALVTGTVVAALT